MERIHSLCHDRQSNFQDHSKGSFRGEVRLGSEIFAIAMDYLILGCKTRELRLGSKMFPLLYILIIDSRVLISKKPERWLVQQHPFFQNLYFPGSPGKK